MKIMRALSILSLSMMSSILSASEIDTAISSQEHGKLEYTFADIAGDSSIAMKGNQSVAYLGFGSRLDQVITGGSLHLEFYPSPALRASVSHLRVFLNNELMDVIQIDSDPSTPKQSQTIALDGRFFKNYNQLKFELNGQIDAQCSDGNDPALWWELSSASAIQLDVRNLAIANELSLLPAPFFDARDFHDVTIPFVVPQGLSLTNIHSVSNVASYFASYVKWRDIEFPVYSDTLPGRHAVVFATNNARPAFLKDLPRITQPTIQMVSHPDNPKVKLLLILGADELQLSLAVKGLAASNQLMAGEVAYVNQVQNLQVRQPYDAPNWLPTDRAVRFSELIEGGYQLESQGVNLAPINVSFTLPPDLFTWNDNSIPLRLNYRHSPPQEGTVGSKLSVTVNDGFVRAFSLDSEGTSKQQQIWRLPVFGSESFSESQNLKIPGFKAATTNTVGFNFELAKSVAGECQGSSSSIQYAAIDGNSTVDFSGFPHYIRMPNSQVFASSGFPYSKMADLSETAIVITPQPSDKEIELLLETVGFISKKTGLPAYRYTLLDTWDETQLTDKDILVLGVQSATEFGLASESLAYVNSSEDGQFMTAAVKPEKGNAQDLAKFNGQPATVSAHLSTRGGFASIASFESPVTSNRTVTVLSARNQQSIPLLKKALTENSEQLSGSAVAITKYDITSYQIGDHYFVGSLPLYDLIWYHFSDRPMVMVMVALLLVMGFTLLAWRMLRAYASRRLGSTMEHRND
ncbi:cellulose biosynthesis cyclic di-GMP-binding regulatory protein BcsB [Vibrio methylphosphonaticus]|uniref:cellulose biosynthesis cyclic di-GMP-binding regulatory protein BcsB n=1 Tax=Vibrio methylphosphonaticus TaxID=2946866 RepID=UPI00202A0DCA|nr:cellulose biosynthesis cyclic di-GMP-binding regulatory protein BcsB [Vibrio methylphosphonaticus]MCL9773970.1 cellulose biosynthesis cyclic di-GMP-binding regulatory protein BcsB [Vibrio methylphosphonaticus]